MQYVARLLLLLGVTLVAPLAAGAEEELSPAERKKRIAKARKAMEADHRDFVARVNKAIDRGHDWLKAQQKSDGTFHFHWPNRAQNLGRQAFYLFTLAKCGSGPKSKEIKAGLKGLAHWEGRVAPKDMKTYSVAALILFYDALYNPTPKPKKDTRYAAPKVKKCKYPKLIRQKLEELVKWLADHQEEQVWRYPGGNEGNQDLSHTQYVLLALQAAARCGIEATPEVYKKVLPYIFAEQQQDGDEERLWMENPAWEPGVEDRYGRFLPGARVKARGWDYRPGNFAVTGSMTTAGIGSLAIIKERLDALGALDKETTKKIDASMLSGLAWLGVRFNVEKNPGQGGWHYYYLYGLERVGALLGMKFIGKHDWYREGAEYLLAKQTEAGGWPAGPAGAFQNYEDELLQTCFALLFLKRATVPPATPIGPVVTGD